MEEKVPRSNIIETEIPMGTVHPAALEPYRVRLFVEDEIVQEELLHMMDYQLLGLLQNI